MTGPYAIYWPLFLSILPGHNLVIHLPTKPHFSFPVAVATAPMVRSVRFADQVVASVHTFPRVPASCIQDMYYQDDDYRRFREEKWLLSVRRRHSTCGDDSDGGSSQGAVRHVSNTSSELNKQSREQSRKRRGSMQFIKGRRDVSLQQGVALAA